MVEKYQELEKNQEIILREKALAELEALAANIQERGEDLSLREAEEKADRFVREVVQDMVAERKISYQGK